MAKWLPLASFFLPFNEIVPIYDPFVQKVTWIK